MSNCTSNFLSPPFPSSSLVYLLSETMEPPANSNHDEKRTQVGETEVLSVEERDVLALARLGKKPVLKVWNHHHGMHRCIDMTSLLTQTSSDDSPSSPSSGSHAPS